MGYGPIGRTTSLGIFAKAGPPAPLGTRVMARPPINWQSVLFAVCYYYYHLICLIQYTLQECMLSSITKNAKTFIENVEENL